MDSSSPPSLDYSAAGEKPSPVSGAAGEKPSGHEVRQVTKFRDRYGRVVPYCRTFGFEVDPNYDPLDTDSEEEDDDFKPIGNVADSIPGLIKHVNQIRESFGFDVDCVAPNWFRSTYYPINMARAKVEKEWLYTKIMDFADFAIAEINSDLIHEGKSSVELVELEKVVWNISSMDLLTLRVKMKEHGDGDGDKNVQTIQAIIYEGHGDEPPLSLEQWRFKPVEPDFWYKAPPLPQTETGAPDL